MSDSEKYPINGFRGSIPRDVARIVYEEYADDYGRDQSFERMAERGGFGPGEIARHLAQRIKKLERLTDDMRSYLENWPERTPRGIEVNIRKHDRICEHRLSAPSHERYRNKQS